MAGWNKIGPIKKTLHRILSEISNEHIQMLIEKKSKGKLLNEQEKNYQQEIHGTLEMLNTRLSENDIRVIKFLLIFKNNASQIEYLDKIIKIISE